MDQIRIDRAQEVPELVNPPRVGQRWDPGSSADAVDLDAGFPESWRQWRPNGVLKAHDARPDPRSIEPAGGTQHQGLSPSDVEPIDDLHDVQGPLMKA